MYGFETEQIVLAVVVWAVAFLSSLARSFSVSSAGRRGGRRDTVAARVSFACTSGFAAVVWIGCIAFVAGNDWLMSNRFGVVCFSSIVGALGPEQQAVFIGSMLEVGNRILNKKDDEQK